MKKRTVIIIALCLIALVLLTLAVRRQMVKKSPVVTDNARNFGTLVMDLVRAYETPSEKDMQTIEADLETIRSVKEDDYAVARALTDTWQKVYLDPDYRLFLYGKDDPSVLEEYGIVNSPSQAIVVLGFELSNGEMQPELISRCDAASELAKAFPEAILVCSGGATGKNNPDKHTEAGLMKEYLTQNCGIDSSRIYTDEEAMTTVENVRKTFEILEKQDVHTMTIVTSQYHQKRSQALYGVMTHVYRQERDYTIQSVGNFCYEKTDTSNNTPDDRLAIQGMVELLHLPKEAVPFTPPPITETNTQDRIGPAA